MNRQKMGLIVSIAVAVVCIVLLWIVNTNNGYDLPSAAQTAVPAEPTAEATEAPATAESTEEPTEAPATAKPTAEPTEVPATAKPTAEPTEAPATAEPTEKPATAEPTEEPTEKPATAVPTVKATKAATAKPTEKPVTAVPTAKPTKAATAKPTEKPATAVPTVKATKAVTAKPTEKSATAVPTVKATKAAMAELTEKPATAVPTVKAALAAVSAVATAEPTEVPATPAPTQEPPLYGRIVGIDPGHQAQGNSEKEAVAPGSSEKKAKVSSGTTGRYTGAPEYETNLEVSLQLRDALEALGATVVMARETNDVDISNQERAIRMNEAGCDLVLRIHCDGAEDSSANGIGLYIRETGTGAEECEAAAELLLPAMVEATGAKGNGIYKSDTYTGLNWSEVPCILVEMGYMTNPDEDEKLNDPAYQQLLVEGMVNGVIAYLSDAPLE